VVVVVVVVVKNVQNGGEGGGGVYTWGARHEPDQTPAGNAWAAVRASQTTSAAAVIDRHIYTLLSSPIERVGRKEEIKKCGQKGRPSVSPTK
jgi:hypothetical protein